MAHDELIEAMRKRMGNARNWEGEPFGENLTTDELNTLATAAYQALRDTLEPVGWLYQFRQQPPVYMDEKKDWADYLHNDGWTETPLYTLPEVKP